MKVTGVYVTKNTGKVDRESAYKATMTVEDDGKEYTTTALAETPHAAVHSVVSHTGRDWADRIRPTVRVNCEVQL